MSQNYHKEITFKSTPESAFRALTTGYDKWWTETQGQSFNKVGDRIKFAFPPNKSYWVFEATKLIPGKLVQAKCVEAYHLLEGKPPSSKNEWLGTELDWKISVSEGTASIDFTHRGLTSELHCYDVCEQGWDFFFVNSLLSYLDTGVGMPHSEGS